MAKGTDTRVTYRRRHSYATRGNKIQKIHTPGASAGGVRQRRGERPA
jgi:hypothetical protein